MIYIFAGWLLVLIYFRINGFDILPDFIGYGLIFAGVDRLSARSDYFHKARIFALLMCAVSFGELLHLETVATDHGLLFMVLLIAVSALRILVPLYLMYLITKGVAELEWDMGAHLGAYRLMQAWKINAIATSLLCILTVLLTGIFHIDSGMIFLMTVLMVCILLVNIAWVICFYGCKKRYDAAEEQQIGRAHV